MVSEDCREASGHRLKGDNDHTSSSSHSMKLADQKSMTHYRYLWSAPYREEGEEETKKILLGP